MGLLQTPVLIQRGVLSIDLFGPLPERDGGEKWVLLIENTATRFLELTALKDATAEVCAPARIVQYSYFLRYGFQRRVIWDNGVQFVSAVMQQTMFLLGIKKNLIPLYHPEPTLQNARIDLKNQLSMLVEKDDEDSF